MNWLMRKKRDCRAKGKAGSCREAHSKPARNHLSARQFIREYAVSGDVGADEFVKVIDRVSGYRKGDVLLLTFVIPVTRE